MITVSTMDAGDGWFYTVEKEDRACLMSRYLKAVIAALIEIGFENPLQIIEAAQRWGCIEVEPRRLEAANIVLPFQGNRVNGSTGYEACEEVVVPGSDATLEA